MGKVAGKPRGKMSAYAFFVQTCREEFRRKHPGERVVFADFSKKCAERWKLMGGGDRQRFDEMAERDKIRFENDMRNFELSGRGQEQPVRRRKRKDPNAPKRALSSFLYFCNDERQRVREMFPGIAVGDTAKELGRRWEVCTDRAKYEELAARDRLRYESAMLVYRSGGSAPTSSGDYDLAPYSTKVYTAAAAAASAAAAAAASASTDE